MIHSPGGFSVNELGREPLMVDEEALTGNRVVLTLDAVDTVVVNGELVSCAVGDVGALPCCAITDNDGDP